MDLMGYKGEIMEDIQYTNTMKGSELVLQTVKKRQKPGMIVFTVLTAILFLLGVVGFIIENYVLVAVAIMFMWIPLIFMIIFIVRYTHPMKCNPLKKNPVLLKQADWMIANMNYQDEILIISPNFFAPKSDISAVIPVQEVLLMYKRVVTTNLTTMYFWVVDTVRGSVSIPYTKKQEELISRSVQILTPLCPYVKVGHSQENLNYREYMKTMWEQTQKNQGTM